MSKEVELAFISDNNYVMQLYVTLLSLKDSMYIDSIYKIHLILMNVSKENQGILLNLSDKNFQINIIEKTCEKIKNLDNKFIQFYSPAIFLKLELDKILNNSEKVLFLDCDVIIKKDLTSLFNIDLNGCYLGACKDIFPTIHYAKTENKYYDKYFNVGVLLLNLDLIRKDNFFVNAIKYYEENGHNFMYPEQDTLNQIIGDKIAILPPIYNWITSNKIFATKQLSTFYKVNKKSFNENNIVIFHYAGQKPWKFYPSYYGKYWEKYYKISPFYNKNLKRIKKYNIFIRFCAFIKNQIRIFSNRNLYKKIGIY